MTRMGISVSEKWNRRKTHPCHPCHPWFNAPDYISASLVLAAAFPLLFFSSFPFFFSREAATPLLEGLGETRLEVPPAQ